MKLYIFIFFTTIIYSICYDVYDFPLDNNTIILTDSTYEKAIKQFKHLMIFFYAPWCPHCQNFEPEYQSAADDLKKENIYLAKIDGSTDKKASQKYKVSGYPSILFSLKKNQSNLKVEELKKN